MKKLLKKSSRNTKAMLTNPKKKKKKKNNCYPKSNWEQRHAKIRHLYLICPGLAKADGMSIRLAFPNTGVH